MYNVNAENPLIDQYGIGKGEAQIIDPSILIRQQEVAAAKQERAAAAKAKKEEEKAADIQAQIAGMKTGDIMPHDSNLVKEKLQAMRDYAVKNADKLRAGDMEAQMGFDAVKNDAGILIANSIDKKNNYAATAKQVSEHERDYLPGTLDKLLGFAGTDYAGQQFIPTKFVQANTDLDAMANKIVDERLKISAQPLTETPTGYGATKTTQENIYARDSAINDMEQAILSDPVAIHKAAWELHNDPKISADDKKKLYGYDASIPDDLGGAKIENLAKYAAEKRADRMVYNHSINKRSAGWKPNEGEGSGETGADVIDNTPSTYKMTTPSTTGEPVDATATSIANGRLSKNISKNLTLTTDIRDINRNSLPFAKGVYPISGSDIKVMPVYKKGAKGVSGDLSGSIIPDGRIDNAIKAGVIEYQPIFMGKMTVPDIDETTGEQKTYINTIGVEIPLTKEISITAPARLLKGGLGKSEKTFDELNRIAEEKNATIKGAPKAAASSAAAPKAYTRAELKAMSPSYTDAVIDAGVKSGKIKLK